MIFLASSHLDISHPKKVVFLLLVLTTALLIKSPQLVAAEIYSWVETNGTTVFTDLPRKGAKKIQLSPLQTFSAYTPAIDTAPPASAQTPTNTLPAFDGYQAITIDNPKNNSVLRSNNGNVSISFTIQPELQKKIGHFIEVKIDGKVAGNTRASPFELNVSRGQHVASVTVYDADNMQLIASSPIRFHVLKARIKKP